MHGGSEGSGGQPGNQNARKHGSYAEYIKAEDLALVFDDPAQQLRVLQGAATLRALKAGKAADEAEESKRERLDDQFGRNARAAATLARALIGVAKAQSEGLLRDAAPPPEPSISEMSDDGLDARIAELITETGTPRAAGGEGPPPEDEPAPPVSAVPEAG